MTENRQSSILVVDDNPNNLRLIVGILKGKDFRVRPAKDGMTALNLAMTHPPDLILLDILMPGMDGYETCRKLKSDPETKDIPVIFISALDASFDKVKAFETGGVDYVSKPFNEEELLARIDTHIALRNMQKSLAEKNARLQMEIAERKRAENTSRESEQRFATVMNSMEAIIYVADMKNYELLFVNEYTRRTFGDVEGQICWKTLQNEQTGPCSFCTNEKLVSDGRPTGIYSWDFQNTKSGRWYHIQNQAIRWTDGRLVRLEIATDITDLKHTEEALRLAKKSAETANHSKSVFLSNMSHELRTPMNAILGFTQIIRSDKTLAEEHRGNLDIIHRSGEHLLTLINDVLDMSKIEAGQTTLNNSDFDLHRLLEDIRDMLTVKADQKGVPLTVECGDDVPNYIRADEIKLRQILINLIGNALKFTSKGGVTVRVVCGNQNGQSSAFLHFSIRDTGSGIDPGEMEILFDPFVQTKTGIQTQEGTGLGLPISRKFVRLMGGDIKVESEAGRGTTFAFHIRIDVVEPTHIETPAVLRRAVTVAPGCPRYKILVTDDSPDNRKYLSQIIEPFGFALRDAANGQEAVEIWREWKPHLIWMDIRMPVMDGYEAVKNIRSYEKAAPKRPKVFIIAQTASTFEEERALVLEAGWDDFLRKPFSGSDVCRLMEKHLGIRFIYEEAASEQKESYGRNDGHISPEDFSGLPEALLIRLKKAAIIADMDDVGKVIEKVREIRPALADSLNEFATNFDFHKIVQLIEDAKRLGEEEKSK